LFKDKELSITGIESFVEEVMNAKIKGRRNMVLFIFKPTNNYTIATNIAPQFVKNIL